MIEPGLPPIVQVVLSLAPGGTERLVIDMTRVLATRRRCVVICLDDAGAWAPALEQAGVSVYALHRAPGFQPRLAQRIAALARAHGARILHCHQ